MDNKEKLRLGRTETTRPVRSKELPADFLAKRNQSNLMGKFYFDETKKPDGFRYNWKRFSCVGKEDKQYMIYLQNNYWNPVPGSRHPETGGQGDSPIIVEGLMLMECPEHIAAYMDAEPADLNAEAMNTQRQKLETSTHKDMPRVVQKFSRSVEPSQSIPL